MGCQGGEGWRVKSFICRLLFETNIGHCKPFVTRVGHYASNGPALPCGSHVPRYSGCLHEWQGFANA